MVSPREWRSVEQFIFYSWPQKARFGVGSPEGDESFATPSLVIAETGDRIPLEAGDVVGGSKFTANSFTIADAVMKSLSSGLTASHVLGASESRNKSRPPPPGSVKRAERSTPYYSAVKRNEEQWD